MVNILEILGKLGFDWQVALANLVNFLIIVFILKKYAFAPVSRIITQRQEKIKKGLEDAKLAATERMMAEETGRALIEKAKDEASGVMMTTIEEKGRILQKAIEDAKKQSEKILQDGNLQNQKKLQKMERDFQEHSIDLVIEATKKSLEKEVGESENAVYSKKFV